MWRRVSEELPEQLAGVTTTIWQYEDIVQVGVMRHSMLTPPVLWAKIINSGFRNVRKSTKIVDELQQLLHAPVVLAETEQGIKRNADLLLFLGFAQLPDQNGRHQYQRSI